MHEGVEKEFQLYARNTLSIDNWVTMRHYNDSAIIKARAIKNASGQAFPAGTQKLYVGKIPRKILFITGNSGY